MSDSLNRKINAYPNTYLHVKVKAEAERTGASVSQIVCEALKERYIQKEKQQSKK